MSQCGAKPVSRGLSIWRNKVRIHRYANAFPMMGGSAFGQLKDDIVENGQSFPIIINKEDGLLVDGRNRLKACTELGIECSSIEVDFVDDAAIYSYIESNNKHRRHLTSGQRAAMATELGDFITEVLNSRKAVLVTRQKEARKKHAEARVAACMADPRYQIVNEAIVSSSNNKVRDIAGLIYNVSGKLVSDVLTLRRYSTSLFDDVWNDNKTVREAIRIMRKEIKDERETNVLVNSVVTQEFTEVIVRQFQPSERLKSSLEQMTKLIDFVETIEGKGEPEGLTIKEIAKLQESINSVTNSVVRRESGIVTKKRNSLVEVSRDGE